jgi:serine protease Do
VEFGGTAIKEVPELQRRVARVSPGDTVRVKVMRERAPVTLGVRVGEMPTEEPQAATAPETESWGLSVEPLTGATALRLNLPVSSGLLVTEVTPEGAADKAGLRRGDVILEVGRQPVADSTDLPRALGALKPGDSVLVYIHRPAAGGRNEYVVMRRE